MRLFSSHRRHTKVSEQHATSATGLLVKPSRGLSSQRSCVIPAKRRSFAASATASEFEADDLDAIWQALLSTPTTNGTAQPPTELLDDIWLQHVHGQGKALAAEMADLRAAVQQKAEQLVLVQREREAEQARLQETQLALQEALDHLGHLSSPSSFQGQEELQKQLDEQRQALQRMEEKLASADSLKAKDLAASQARLAELESALAEADAHLSEGSTRNEISGEESWAARLKEKNRQLEAELEAAKAQVASLQESIQVQEDAGRALEAEAEQLRRHMEESDAHLVQLHAQLQALESSQEAAGAERKSLEEELEEFRRQNSQLSAQASTSESMGQELEAMRQDYEQALSRENEKSAELNDAAEVAEVLTGELERLGQLVEEQAAQLQQLQEAAPQDTHLTEQVGRLQAELRESQQALQTAEAAELASQGTIKKLEVEISQLKQQGPLGNDQDPLHDLRRQAQEEAAAATKLLSKAEAATKHLSQQMTKLKELQASATSANGSPREALGDEVPDEDTLALLEELESIAEQLDDAVAAEQEAQDRAQAVELQASSLHEQLLAVQAAAHGGAQAREAEREQLVALQSQYVDAHAQATALRKQVVELEQQLQEARSQASTPKPVRRRSNAEDNKLTEMEARIVALEQEKAELHNENLELHKAAARHSALLQQSRRFLSTYMEASPTQPRGPFDLPIPDGKAPPDDQSDQDGDDGFVQTSVDEWDGQGNTGDRAEMAQVGAKD